MTDEQMIDALRKVVRENRMEIQGLKDLEDLRVSVIRKLEYDNRSLKASKDELLELARGYLAYVNRNGDDFVSGDLMRIIENKILKAEALKEKETK